MSLAQNPNPTPRQLFNADPKAVSRHRDLVGDAFFNMCLEQSMLEYDLALASQSPCGQDQAAANFNKMAGVREFVAVFKKLTYIPDQPGKAAVGKLDYKQ